MPVHVAAEMNARDRFLTGVTALGVGYRLELLEIRFLRNRRVVHVDSPLGTPGLDACDVPDRDPRGLGAGVDEAPPPARRLIARDDQRERIEADIRNTRDDSALA